jgi:alpha/beta hydrolase fold
MKQAAQADSFTTIQRPSRTRCQIRSLVTPKKRKNRGLMTVHAEVIEDVRNPMRGSACEALPGLAVAGSLPVRSGIGSAKSLEPDRGSGVDGNPKPMQTEEQMYAHEQATLTPASGSASIAPTRRRFMLAATATAAAYSSMSTQRWANAATVQTDVTRLPPLPLPAGIRSRYVSNINGLTFHVLEAGFEERGRPCVLLLHGYPELAYGWRKVMPPLAAAGFHVLAPDMRGYGRTTGWDDSYDGDVFSFRHTNLV